MLLGLATTCAVHGHTRLGPSARHGSMVNWAEDYHQNGDNVLVSLPRNPFCHFLSSPSSPIASITMHDHLNHPDPQAFRS